MIVLELIRGALRAIRAIEPGGAIEAPEAADGLAVLNRMLSSWALDRLSVPVIQSNRYPLTAGKQSYTIGRIADAPTPADIDVERPVRIQSAVYIDGQGSRHDLALWDDEQFADVRQQARSGRPYALYNDRAHPISNLAFFPVPAEAGQFELNTWKPVSSFASVQDDLILPPGYEEAITYNLALRLAPEYGARVSAEVMQLAREAKAAVQSFNAPSPIAECDSAIFGVEYQRRRGWF